MEPASSPTWTRGKGRLLVLRMALGEPEVTRVIDALVKKLELRGIHFELSLDRDEAREATAYYLTSPVIRLTHVEDYSTGLSYLEVHPREGALTEEALAALAALPILSIAELLAIATRGYKESPELLVALGTAVDRAEDPGTTALLRTALSDRDPNVRDWAAQGMAHTGWKSFLPDLTLLAQDASERVRQVAELAAGIIRGADV